MKVSIQGEVGSFSEEAVLRMVCEKAEIVSFRHFEEVFAAVVDRSADACVVPLENSLTGSIHRNYDLLLRNKLKVNGELYLPIQHNLIVIPGTELEEIRTVISHPVALGQCERFFEQHPGLEMETSYDTSGSVREVIAQGNKCRAAIAGPRASEAFGGEVLMEGIQDSEANYTRFVLLGNSNSTAEKGSKSSVVFSFRNVPGALFKSLSVFALRDIDLIKIESRPILGRPWEYLFYLDFLGNLEEERVKNALGHLREIAELVEVLGCYPRDKSVQKSGI